MELLARDLPLEWAVVNLVHRAHPARGDLPFELVAWALRVAHAADEVEDGHLLAIRSRALRRRLGIVHAHPPLR